mgnify:CR=1 FL=1
MTGAGKDIILSFCIPTYNRAVFIGETLRSIISQADERIEIVVVDGASTDNTAEVIRQYQQQFPNLVYFRGEKKRGVDRDMAKSIELARGEYCWMLSDDDVLCPGAVDRILKETGLGCEIFLCNATNCDLSLRPLKDRFWLSRRANDRIFDFCDRKDLILYCRLANSLGAIFSYMSSIILLRRAWNRAGFQDSFDGSAYALAASLFSFRSHKCRLKYIREPLLLCRGDNESFSGSAGLVKRFLLDFDGYLRLADIFLGNDKAARRVFLKVMTREHPWYTIIHVASLIDIQEAWLLFKKKLVACGYNPLMVSLCRFLSGNEKLVSLAVALKRKIVRNRAYLWFNRIITRVLFLKQT